MKKIYKQEVICSITLLDDSSDFSWQAAKALHAVLLCRMEQGEIASWAETEKNRPDPKSKCTKTYIRTPHQYW